MSNQTYLVLWPQKRMTNHRNCNWYHIGIELLWFQWAQIYSMCNKKQCFTSHIKKPTFVIPFLQLNLFHLFAIDLNAVFIWIFIAYEISILFSQIHWFAARALIVHLHSKAANVLKETVWLRLCLELKLMKHNNKRNWNGKKCIANCYMKRTKDSSISLICVLLCVWCDCVYVFWILFDYKLLLTFSASRFAI